MGCPRGAVRREGHRVSVWRMILAAIHHPILTLDAIFGRRVS